MRDDTDVQIYRGIETRTPDGLQRTFTAVDLLNKVNGKPVSGTVVILKEKGVKGHGRFVITEWPDIMPRLNDQTSVRLHQSLSWSGVEATLVMITGNRIKEVIDVDAT